MAEGSTTESGLSSTTNGSRASRAPRLTPAAKPSLPAASMPPAAKKFLAKVARAVKSAGLPRLARKIFGRVPVRAHIRSEASRSASNGSARRMRGNGSNANVEGDDGATGATSSTDTGASARSGKSLVPVNASLRRATASWRSARTTATFFWIMPCSSAAHAPPARSISWNWVQAARQSCSVTSSTPPAPRSTRYAPEPPRAETTACRSVPAKCSPTRSSTA